MALTFSRWVAAAVVGCAIVAALVLRDSGPRMLRGDPVTRTLEVRSSLARRHAVAAAERARVLRLRDSLAPAIVAGDSGLVRIDSRLAEPTRVALDSLVNAARARRPGSGAVPMSVLLLLDSAHALHGTLREGRAEQIDYLLPSAATHGRCVVLARLGAEWLSNRTPASFAERYTYIENRTDLLTGPCAYLAAFGEPGPHVAEWLRARGWRFARGGTWSVAPQPSATRPTSNSEDLFNWNTWLFRTRTTVAGQACAAGDVAACRRAFFDTTASGWQPWGPDGGILSAGSAAMQVFDPYEPPKFGLGFSEVHLLADLERSLGREKFARFWRSTLPLDEAFQESAGVSIGEWTREWAQANYGARPRGPELAGASVGFAGLLVLVAIGVAALAGRRRAVG